MNKPTIAIDLGGILLSDPTKVFFDEPAGRTLWFDELRIPFERGQLEEQSLWLQLAAVMHDDPDALRARFLAGFQPLPRGIEALEHLYVEGHPLILATNHYHPWLQIWKDRFPWFSLFGGVVCSSQVHARKPERAFMELLVLATQTDSSALVLVDDDPLNVAGARSVGAHGILGDETGQWLAKVTSFSAQRPG